MQHNHGLQSFASRGKETLAPVTAKTATVGEPRPRAGMGGPQHGVGVFF